MLIVDSQVNAKSTRLAYVATRVLDTPFWALYNMLPVILYKDLHATALQITLLIAIRPLVSLLSMYWSSAVSKRRDRLLSNIISARVLAYIPFFLFPLIDNVWFYIFTFGLYMMLAVGIVPAWMEILKLNIPPHSRERVFSYSQAFGYMGGGLLPFALGWILDGYFQAWRFLFPVAALIAWIAFFFQKRLVIPPDDSPQSESSLTWSVHLFKPWKSAWETLKTRPDFKLFQLGFMIVGCGLMIIQPALPIFFVDTLKLSYTELAIAITLCKGIGFALASPIWSQWMQKIHLFRLTSLVAALGCLFPLFLAMTYWQMSALYLGYIVYGIMQSGNELIWNMSGPTFSKNEDSSVFTSINILAIGVRGCFIPAIGTLCCSFLGAHWAMLCSSLLCALGAFSLLNFSQNKFSTSRA